MNPRLFLKLSSFSLGLGVLAPAACPAAVPPLLPWSQGDPTPDEQVAMEWLNAARQDPNATLAGLVNQAGADTVMAAFLLGELPLTPAELKQNLQTAVAVAQANSLAFPDASAISSAPLVFYPLFQKEAAIWGATSSPPAFIPPAQRLPPAYLYPTPIGGTVLSGTGGLNGPNATGGTAIFGADAFATSDIVQANLYDPALTGREYVLSLLCNPGSGSPPPSFLLQGDALPNLTLGHIRMAGIDLSPGQAGGRVLTIFQGNDEFFSQSDLPFGHAGTVFITGVAYQDNNGNGRYDSGEGVAGVEITPDRGEWYAVTASAGGYAIPVPANSGSYNLSAAGGPFAGATALAVVGNDSVKIDWVLPAAAPVLPPQVAVPPPDGAPQIVGLSTRGLVQTGDTALIGGFVIAGPAGSRKRLLLRGVGPSLQTAGFPAAECVPATALGVYGATQEIAANSGWTTAGDGGAAAVQAAAQVGDFPLVDWAGGGGDSALVLTLAPGVYSAVVSPAPGAPPADQAGLVGLLEIYDLSPADGSRLVNISTRGLIGADDSRMIVGCTLAGSGHERLLLRGIGPALTGEFGLGGSLPNPTLTLNDSSGKALQFNDDWSLSPQTQQIQALAETVGAFPLPPSSVDSALLALLPPGNYSVTISPKAGTALSGIALIELYETP